MICDEIIAQGAIVGIQHLLRSLLVATGMKQEFSARLDARSLEFQKHGTGRLTVTFNSKRLTAHSDLLTDLAELSRATAHAVPGRRFLSERVFTKPGQR